MDTKTTASKSFCEHGNLGYCGLCEAENAPKCKHGNPYYCGRCGKVEDAKKQER